MRRKLAPTLLLLLAFAVSALGQDSYGGIFYSRYRQFRIPFQSNLAQQGIKQLQLFVSMDNGRSWQPSAFAAPEQAHFRFLSDRDGLFWFAVQTTDVQNRVNPISLEGAQPSLKVIVDTQPPVVALQSLPARGGEVGVAWDLRDENLDLTLADAIRLEYRLPGGSNWLPLPRSTSSNQHYWRPEAPSLEVRLRARDRAGNWGEQTTTVTLGGGSSYPQSFPDNQQPQSPPTQSEPDRRFVNSKRISLAYELKEVGPSGVSQLELWFTQDGRSWNKYPHKLTEDPQNKTNIAFDIAGEGIYGLSLVARSGVGLGERPPQIGDQPQLWVEVDLSKPVVQLYNVIVGQGIDKGKLTVTWAARDKNLQKLPITIAYKADNGGWIPMAQNLQNTGRYIWNMPDQLPYQFHVRVEAIDLAGNIGEATTEQMVKVDLSQPKAKILNVEPGGR